ncbi:MAG: NUDIX domain-containing protein [Chitinispirillales bacterium]|jgi:NADH pyrophosphatase NudC (nudix superfamily)|nr:NUDIX domain-containing protein [Chitinispirillales bacterium]
MDNKEVLKYCPRCSAHAVLADSRKIVCAGCGFQIYLNTAAAVAALLFDGDSRLMAVRRNHEPRSGMLDLPGGFVDFGETAEEALSRELREELGITVCGIEYYRSIPNKYQYGGVLYHTLDIFLKCRFDDGVDNNIRPNDEISEVVYKRPGDISEDEIAFDSMKKLIKSLKIN